MYLEYNAIIFRFKLFRIVLIWVLNSTNYLSEINQSTKSNNFGALNYLFDETQEIAKKYGAVCTPDFFGYNNELQLQYRGRFKELKDLKPINNKVSDLKLAMKMIAQTQKGPIEQIPSMGCSIKWFN